MAINTLLYPSPHGGQCCGRKHLYNFPSVRDKTLEEKTEWVRAQVRRTYPKHGTSDRGLCIEIVLTSGQVRNWGAAVLAAGFEKVFEFKNQNSRATCHVFLMDTGKVKIR